MQSIFNFRQTVTFQLGNNSTPHIAIVDNVFVEKRVIGETTTTLVYYDLDVLYDPDRGLHTLLKHVHSAYVS